MIKEKKIDAVYHGNELVQDVNNSAVQVKEPEKHNTSINHNLYENDNTDMIENLEIFIFFNIKVDKMYNIPSGELELKQEYVHQIQRNKRINESLMMMHNMKDIVSTDILTGSQLVIKNGETIEKPTMFLMLVGVKENVTRMYHINIDAMEKLIKYVLSQETNLPEAIVKIKKEAIYLSNSNKKMYLDINYLRFIMSNKNNVLLQGQTINDDDMRPNLPLLIDLACLQSIYSGTSTNNLNDVYNYANKSIIICYDFSKMTSADDTSQYIIKAITKSSSNVSLNKIKDRVQQEAIINKIESLTNKYINVSGNVIYSIDGMYAGSKVLLSSYEMDGGDNGVNKNIKVITDQLGRLSDSLALGAKQMVISNKANVSTKLDDLLTMPTGNRSLFKIINASNKYAVNGKPEKSINYSFNSRLMSVLPINLNTNKYISFESDGTNNIMYMVRTLNDVYVRDTLQNNITRTYAGHENVGGLPLFIERYDNIHGSKYYIMHNFTKDLTSNSLETHYFYKETSNSNYDIDDVKLVERKIIDMYAFSNSPDYKINNIPRNAYVYDIWYESLTFQTNIKSNTNNESNNLDADISDTKLVQTETIQVPICVFFIQKTSDGISLHIAESHFKPDNELKKNNENEGKGKRSNTLYDIEYNWIMKSPIDKQNLKWNFKSQKEYIDAIDQQIKNYISSVRTYVDSMKNMLKNSLTVKNLAATVIVQINKMKQELKKAAENKNNNQGGFTEIGKLDDKAISIKLNYNDGTKKWNLTAQNSNKQNTGKTTGIVLNNSGSDLEKYLSSLNIKNLNEQKKTSLNTFITNNQSNHKEIVDAIKNMMNTRGGAKRKRIRRTMKVNGDNMMDMINILSKSSERTYGRKTKKRI